MSHIDLPELCELMRGWYPEMKGRVVASAGDDITADNMPALPLINLALSRLSVSSANAAAGVNARLKLYDEIDIEFWQEPLRLKRKDGTESPFWTYYPFHGLMADLMARLAALGARRRVSFELAGAALAPARVAVIVSFHIRQHFILCLPEQEQAEEKLSQAESGGLETMFFSRKLCAARMPAESEREQK